MSIITLPDDMLLHILTFLDSEDIKSIRCSCKRFCDIIGLRHIEYGQSRLLRFLQLCKQSSKTLKSIKVSNMNCLKIPINVWPRKVIFDRCSLGIKTIVDPNETSTEILVIRDLHRTSQTKTHVKKLFIDWTRFPKLRILDLYLNSVDLSGIEYCKELEGIRLDLSEVYNLPDVIATLPKLKFIASSCPAKQTLHFESSQLRVCFVPSKEKFTSNSSLVPISHLEGTYGYINLQCFEPSDYCN